jgi:hypothetical protein
LVSFAIRIAVCYHDPVWLSLLRSAAWRVHRRPRQRPVDGGHGLRPARGESAQGATRAYLLHLGDSTANELRILLQVFLQHRGKPVCGVVGVIDPQVEVSQQSGYQQDH